LRRYLEAHPDTFRTERRFTFSQVYLNPQQHGENLARDATQLRKQLQQEGGTADISALGDALLLDYQFDALPTSEVAKQFGEQFAVALSTLEPGQWQGPIESGYGAHLVFVSERTEGRVPALEEVRTAVRREWANALRREANEKFYQALLQRYTVTVEQATAVKDRENKQLAEVRK
jgi:PPIC-type PPIASE domain